MFLAKKQIQISWLLKPADLDLQFFSVYLIAFRFQEFLWFQDSVKIFCVHNLYFETDIFSLDHVRGATIHR